MGARFYLLVLVWLVIMAAAVFVVRPGHAQELRAEYVRVTFYVEHGRMADGALVHEGAAACSAWMPTGTLLEFPDGRQVTCQDRGHGDWYWPAWVDVWMPSRAAGFSEIEGTYGMYSWVTVTRWGWDE